MAEVKGKLCTCDRCGAQVFLRTTGDAVTDGGWTRWNQFEPYPKGWDQHTNVGRLCPACNAKYKTILGDFMNQEKNN
ncbi:MAG: hypothetical protein IKY91_00055 [Akkermansia sp.]|nr:hypothetical protein [Akkermansia sp.]